MRNTIKMMVAVAWVIGVCGFASCSATSAVCSQSDANSVSAVLDEMRQETNRLQSYQCKVEYLFSQPVLESKTLRTGMLYYTRFGDGSKLRINFDTLTQDDGPQQNYKECYIFDGQWLTHIDYQIKQVQKRQLAEANELIDAFELAKRNFPIIGFSKTDDLKKEFEVNLIGEPNGLIHLNLKVKPDSQYKDDYKSVEIWIDTRLGEGANKVTEATETPSRSRKGLMLPSRLTAVSTEDDIYEISFVEPKVNEPIDEKIFEVTIPAGFGRPEIIPLKK